MSIPTAYRVVGLAVSGWLLVVLGMAAPPQGGPPAAAVAPDTTEDEPVEILGADFGERLFEAEEPVRRLVGHVRIKQGETFIWSDEARQYEARDEIVLTGTVRIVERGDSLAADTVYYDSNTKVGRALGNVELTDGDVVVYAPSGRYFTEEKRAEFDDGVTLIDSTSTLQSRAGQYWSDEKRAEFYDDVRLDAERSYLEADSVTYFRETDISIARGRVFIERIGGEEDEESDPDSLSIGLLVGDQAYNDEARGLSRVEGQALLVQLQMDTTEVPARIDTVIIRADRLVASREDSLQRLVARGNVQIWQRDFAALADSSVYDRITLRSEPDTIGTEADTIAVDTIGVEPVVGSVEPDTLGMEPDTSVAGAEHRFEEVRLFRNPVGWFEETQVNGDTLRLTRRGGRVDSLVVRNNAFVAQRDTVLERIHQLQGQHLVGLFHEDSLRSLDVGPTAEAIYYLAEEDAPNGGVQVSGDRIIFYFEDGDLKRIRDLGGIEGTYYPEAMLPSPFQLSRYRWEPERRPTDAALLDERIQPRLEAALDRLERMKPPPAPDLDLVPPTSDHLPE